jgi:MFS family permease
MNPTVSDTADDPAVKQPARASFNSESEYTSIQPPESKETSLLEPHETKSSAWLLLRQSNFRIYFLGALASNLGTWFQSTGQIVIAYQVTHSVFIVGLIASAQFAGMAFSPWAAVLADRVGTRNFLVATQCASAGLAMWMAWRYHSGLLGVHTLVFGALGLGLAYALALPVQTALVPSLVSRGDATEAVKMNSVSYNVGRAVAPALYVLVIGFVSVDSIFVVNAVSFIVFAVCLATVLRRLNHTSGHEQVQHGPADDPPRSTHPHVTDGFRTALKYRRILLLLAIVGAVTFADDPIFVLSPALAHVRLQMSTHWTGYFIAALGWGCVLGSLPPTSKKDDPRRASRHAAYGLALLSASVVVFAAGFSAQISLLAAFAAGAAGLYTGTAAQTALLSHKTNKNMAGNVTSVAALWAIAWAGTKPFASLLDGSLAIRFGLLPAAAVLISPALAIALCEIWLPESTKLDIKNLTIKATANLRTKFPVYPEASGE